ncbi:MAG: radical SAM protein [Myxococcales bacterium]|nr:radical SAM protein [Myxococcales bacterium]
MDRPRAQRTAKLALDPGDELIHRFAGGGPRAGRTTADALAAVAAIAADARAVVLAVAQPGRRDDLAALIAAAARPVTIECEAAGLDAALVRRLADAGVVGLRIVHGGMRERVFEAVMRAPGAWRAAAAGLAAALAGPLPVELVVPVLAWNRDDVVPLIDWVLALPGQVARVALAVPRAADVPVDARRHLLDHPAVAALAAEAFARLQAARVGFGFDGSDAPWPCAAGDRLDRFATVWHDALRRAASEPDRALTPIAACARCALAGTCRGVEPAYLGAFGDAGLAPVPEARAAAWRLRPTRGGGEVEYAQISPFTNVAAGAGRALIRINGHCQMACAFCFVDRGVGDLPAATVLATIERLATTQRDHVVFSGGEPTLHPELPRFIAHARACGFATVEIQTNGVRASDRAYAAALVAAGLTKATVSLHSMDPATSDAITRMPGAFPRTVAGLHHLAALGVDTQLAHVISKDNYQALPAFTTAMLDEFAGAGRRLSVCFAIAQRISDLVPRWVLPTFTEIRPYVRAALDACDARGVGYGGLIGQGGYPPCVLSGDLRYHRGVLDKVYASTDADAQFAKAPQCARCDFDRACLGVRRDYLAQHGDAELVPFRIARATDSDSGAGSDSDSGSGMESASP